MEKKIIATLVLLVLATTISCASVVDLSSNVTVEMGGVKFEVPPVHSNLTNEYDIYDKGKLLSYEDTVNGINVYVQDYWDDTMSTDVQYEDSTGYSQSVQVGSVWVTVYADDRGTLDAVLGSVRAA